MQSPRHPAPFYLLFTLSGFTGLIYESAWSQYLKLMLGHAAYAQALVLVIYMGGMALGAYLAARLAHRARNLIALYALVEGVIGLGGLAFHEVFECINASAHGTLLPAVASPALARVGMWLLSAVIILPQSMLLGSTFPLMSAGLIRCFPAKPGRTLGVLYFTNTIGGAAGVLASGFWLIAALGLPGTMQLAGFINLAIAAAVFALVRAAREAAQTVPREWPAIPARPWFLLTAAFLTGTASFIYEVGWLRMLTMVLGSSTQSFELMLSAFLIGLALGGFWIRRRLDSLNDPLRAGALVQISMGLFALMTLPLYNFTFDLMAAFMSIVPRTETGFIFFNLTGHGIALFIMLPATFCAGMTLPLFTWLLLARGYGERGIGHVYAANTAGAIAGVLFALFIGMPMLTLHGTILSGAALDMALGIAFIAAAPHAGAQREHRLAVMACLLAMTAATLFGKPDHRRMTSAVFRAGYDSALSDSEVVFHRDGATSSIGLKRARDSLVLTINGKPDASLGWGGPGTVSGDEITMVLSAAIPLAHHPDARSAAVVGMGSGLTTHTLLLAPHLERVDTVEIEPAVVEAVEILRPRIERVFADRRSHIHIEDARAFFSLRGSRYDIIVSEPSNPWVSGVAMLFTLEFYRQMTQFLNRRGLLVQWLQLYEIDEELVWSIIKAFAAHFPHYRLYRTDGVNILIVGSLSEIPAAPLDTLFVNASLAAALERVGIHGAENINSRIIGDEHSIGRLLNRHEIPANSDYRPLLDQRAVKARFLRRNAAGLLSLPK